MLIVSQSWAGRCREARKIRMVMETGDTLQQETEKVELPSHEQLLDRLDELHERYLRLLDDYTATRDALGKSLSSVSRVNAVFFS